MIKTTGIIIGRFNPPHNGHRYMVDFARSLVDELYIFVCTLEDDEIPGTIRHKWMRELFPNIVLRKEGDADDNGGASQVIHINEKDPRAERGKPDACAIWARTVLNKLQGTVPDYVFASEDYGEEFASELGSRFIAVDSGRDYVSVSASSIRQNPFRYWNYLPEAVRPWFIKRILIAVAATGTPDAAAAGTAAGAAAATRAARREEQKLASGLAHYFETFYVSKFPNTSMEGSQEAVLYALARQSQRFLFICASALRSDHQQYDRIMYVASPKNEKREGEEKAGVEKRAVFFEPSENLLEKMRDDLIAQYDV